MTTTGEPPPDVPVLASWGQRVGAFLIDNLLLAVVYTPIVVAMFAILFVSAEEEVDAAGEPSDEFVGLTVVTFLVATLVTGLISALYFTISHGRASGRTLGKRWIGIRVIDADRGGSIGYGRSFARWLVPAIVGWFCGGVLNIVDLLWPLWDDKNQTVHDKIVNSVVVRDN